MTAPHPDLKGNAGAYVLGCLDADERTAFEAHLSTCDECAEEVRALRRVTGALASAVPSRTPPPDLRARVLGAFGTSPARTAVATRATSNVRSWLPLAALFVLTLGVGIYAARLQNRVADLEGRLEEALVRASAADSVVAESRRVAGELQSAMGVLGAPDLARIDLAGQPAAPQASARALWSRSRGMVFTASNLPPLPAGRVYQVWVVTGPAPVSAGLLTPDAAGGGMTYYNTPPDIPPPTAVAVTIEPAGGVPAPTGAFYLLGTPAPAI